MADKIEFKPADDFKTEITLYSGLKVHLDLMQITEKEWRKIFDPKTSDEEEIELVCRVSDMTPEQYKNLKLPEVKQFSEALLKLGLQPTANPS